MIQDVTIRQSGMFVGETFSGWMGGERLEFEYSEDPWLIEMRRIRDGVTEAPASVDKCEQTPPPLECDDVQLPSSSSAVAVTQVVDSDDEEDFPAYEVPESEKKFEVLSDGAEPEKKAPAPYYIRDCYEQLSEKEKYEVVYSSFGIQWEGWIKEYLLEYILKAASHAVSSNVVATVSDPADASAWYLILECFAAAAKELAEFPSEPAPKKVVEISKKNKKEEGRDSPFLARLIFCLSDILQKAANAPTVVKMATLSSNRCVVPT
ncbi:hypothetical protein TELCIR_08432 [Teladorsagia circumcincta]|uniref:Uncharacterized protein n=1 Tax=Teladorsagia circumcincta TaxID=45464 RepID=A0A2G9UHK7_TELCI|nr:hypothetical protein TELCIR_08432 [Teladorsagia circumcincta]